ncbi:hypothetical protein B5C34_04480 [Pacificimonas flava]|uniref:Phytase-like domain-containing protein n=2 Tax=Pacificimonas TaxID=1960290 RepID=A0A219B3A3_9SPHN|nr:MULTISPECIES: esterase-like activity of phytase family protein [Pacificimonas]MBZ6377526.1 esterase-like activity of phytase family protein [Pacificimonas aurantium]OWV32781.1 hypothetical protein B5C34_04480 [Pacificimonas flava]
MLSFSLPVASPFRVTAYLLAVFLFGLSALAAHAEDGPVDVDAEPLPLHAEDRAMERVGRLAYRGGLVLSSAEERFGGISGLRWLGEGNRFLAVTDQGDWLRLDLAETSGLLTGIEQAEIGLMTDARGAPLIAKPLADAEALNVRRHEDGLTASVWFERSHRRQTFRVTEEGRLGEVLSEVPFEADPPLAANGGIEAATSIDSGLFLFAEGAENSEGRIRAFRRWDCNEPRPCTKPVSVRLPAPYRPTDAVSLGGDRLLLLSRHFSPADGVSARIDELTWRRGTTKDGKPFGGFSLKPVAFLKPPLATDNFEGIAIRRSGERTYVYLVSDDNFSPLQRTLLLKFELLPEERDAPARPSEGNADRGSRGPR